MKAKLLGVGMAAMMLGSVAADSYRTFTSSDGQQLQAKVQRATDKTVTLIVRNGRSYKLPLSRFSAGDQEYIKKWRETKLANFEPRLEVKFSSGKGDRSDKLGDFDDRAQFLEPNATITNRELKFTLKDATATVVAIGRGVVQRDEMRVLFKQDFKFSLEPGQTAELAGKKVKVEYDDSNFAKFGHKYAGYVVVVKNEKGNVIHTAGTNAYIDSAEAIMKLSQGQITTRDFR